MNDTLRVRGSFDSLSAGYVVTEDLPYVLTTTRTYLLAGWPVWSYRYSNPLDGQFTGTLADVNRGTARIYSADPAPFRVPQGNFDLGNQGVLVALVNDYLGVFDDFAVFPSDAGDPIVSGWSHPSAPLSINAPTGSMSTAWGEVSAMVFPPKNARFAVPVVNVSNLPASNSVYLDAFDLRVVPATESPTVKPSYVSPRNLVVRVKPTRLNYATGSTTVTSLEPGATYTASADVAGVRESFTFVPTTDTYTLSFSGTPSRILVEKGTALGDYFDGNYGPDYLWEQGGVPGHTRSYYYPDRGMRNYILQRLLTNNVPLGMKVDQPQYGVFSG